MSVATFSRFVLKRLLALAIQPALYATLLLIAIEAAFFLEEGSPWRRYAGYAWLLSAGFMLIVPWIYGVAPFFQRSFWQMPNRIWYLLAFFLPALAMVIGIDGYRLQQFNCEAPQQIAGALKALRTENSLGLFSLGYLGVYPMRGYLPMCWTTLALGPSLLALRLGYGLFYFGTYIAFLSGTLRFLKRLKTPEAPLLSAFAGMMVSLAIYPLVFSRTFEQCMLPIAVTMLFLAGLLHFFARNSFVTGFWVIWTFGFLPYCYTPALATWGLGLLVLLYLIIWHRAYGMVLAAVYGLCALGIAIRIQAVGELLKWKFHLGDEAGPWEHFTPFDWFWRFCYAFNSYAGGDRSLVPAPLAIGLLAALYLSWRARDIRLPLVFLWSLATVAAAISFKGWCWAPPEFDLQRAMVILPFLSLGVVLFGVLYAGHVLEMASTRRVATFLIVFSLLFMVVKSAPVPFLKRTIDSSGEIPTDIEEALATIFTVDIAHHPIKRIYVVPPLDQPVEWGLVYLSPDTEIIRTAPPTGEKIPGTYILSYRSQDPGTRGWSEELPSFQRRPYLEIHEE